MNNDRQMALGGNMFATDNRDALMGSRTWDNGSDMNDNTQNTDPARIKGGDLWPYINSILVYKWPADPKVGGPTGNTPTVRSMSYNNWMSPPGGTGWDGSGRVLKKTTDISSGISPSDIWMFLDENDKTINDGFFVVPGPKTATAYVDCPGTYHHNAGGFSFADGHAEIRKWQDKYVLGKVPGYPALFMPADSARNYADFRWLQQHTTFYSY
jgi:hypothetical protein